MIKALVRSLFYLRSIAKTLDKIHTLYALELEQRHNIRLTNPALPDSDVEVLYGPKQDAYSANSTSR